MKKVLNVRFVDLDDPAFLASLCRIMSLSHLVELDGRLRDFNPLRASLARKLDRSAYPLSLEECILLSELLGQYLQLPFAKQQDRARRLQRAILEAIAPVIDVVPLKGSKMN
ncbi:MAG: hypothetical protein IKS31_05060 [Clostridia bacterium]|nr:hypothetical protein [Clostridia bacterium]